MTAKVLSFPATRGSLEDAAPIKNMQHLLESEEVLDMMAAQGMQNNRVFGALESLMRSYVQNNMGELTAKWPRVAGAVRDMMADELEALLVAAEPQPMQKAQ